MTNAFQSPALTAADASVSTLALDEFDHMVQQLQSNQVDVLVFQDPGEVFTPDSVFPNNWISFHQSSAVYLYPMQAENRRMERRTKEILEMIEENRFQIGKINDLTSFENKGQYLEGTGSMVLDRDHKIAFACLSPRTDRAVLESFCRNEHYRPCVFTGLDAQHKAIYHTNVMMCVGAHFILVCLVAVVEGPDKVNLLQTIASTGKQLIEITVLEMEHFAGNMLEVISQSGEPLIILSSQALKALRSDTQRVLSRFARLVAVPLETIEQNGGGSARCMMAEIHLPQLG